MNEVTVFQNDQFGEVRTMTIDGEPWFVGKDLADILGYSNSRKAIADHVDDEDKGLAKCNTPGGVQDMAIVNVLGLYSLVLGSRKPEAKAFKHWITFEVLPSIRKKGENAMTDKPTPSMSDKVVVVEAAARMLNLSYTGIILMLDRFCRQEGIKSTFLPKYENNGGNRKPRQQRC